jgi:hypothetical protein
VSEPIETPQAPPDTTSERPALSRSSIVVFRLLLLLVAAGAVFAGIAIAFRARDTADQGARYACPMHPEVRAKTAGQCPICQMALEPVARDAANGAKSHAGMGGMADMTAVDNVRKHKILDFVRVRSLLPNLREIRGPARADSDHEISVIFYNDQLAALAPDEPGTFSPTASPKTPVAVTRMAGPAVARDRSTSTVRFRTDAAIAPGTIGWLRVANKSRAVLGVPVMALLQSPEGPYVLAWAGGQRFEKRPIEIGETFSHQGFAVVLSGLRASDRVVSKATFFLDADRRMGGSDDVGLGMPGTAPPGGTP